MKSKKLLTFFLAAALLYSAGLAKAQSYTFTTLNDPNGTNGTVINGISGSTLVGYYNDAEGNQNGFTYNDGTFTTLNDPNGVGGTYISGISGSTLVGYYIDSDDDYNGFAYDGSTFTTLNDPSGVNGTVIAGISGSTLVGYYYDSNNDSNGFIATSVPEPSTYTLFGLGALALVAFYRRRIASSIKCQSLSITYPPSFTLGEGFLTNSSPTTLHESCYSE